MPKNTVDVIIIGAGLAGLSCAMELVEKKYKVLVLESNHYLGGRTASWNEKGMDVESGLHRVLGFYDAFPKLMEKAGIKMDNMVEWLNKIQITLPDGGPHAEFAISPLAKPFESIADILTQNDFLSPIDKLSISKFFVAGIKDYFSDPEKLDTYTVLEYAKKHDLSETVIHRVLVPLTAGIFFLPPEKYSAYALFGLVGPYIPTMYRVGEGAFKGGMTEVMMNPLASAIKKKGGQVKTNMKVEKLLLDENNSVNGVVVDEENIYAENVVLAADIKAAQTIVKSTFGNHKAFKSLLSLKHMPAVTVQIELDEPSLPTDLVTFSPGTILASYAEQTRTTFKTKKGRLSIVLSPPDKYIDMDHKVIIKHVQKDAKRVGIDLSKIKDYRVISHPADFYSLTPGSEKLRPPQKTEIPHLFLAGDYTKQKYLATMEGAVVSGKLTAELVSNSDQ